MKPALLLAGRHGAVDSISAPNSASGRRLLLPDIMILGACLFTASGLFAQNSPATLPNARMSSGGFVFAIALQEDGKVVIGGFFLSVNGAARDSIARINPNGSVDEAWYPKALGGAGTLFWRFAPAGTNLFVSPGLTAEGASVFKVSTLGTGEVATEWNPGVRGSIGALAVSGNDLYIGGSFIYTNALGNLTNLVRVSVTGTGKVDVAWNPNPDGSVGALALDGTNLYVGGTFASISGTSRSGLAKVSTVTGAADPAWNTEPPGGSFSVRALALNGTALFVLGNFNYLGGQPRTNIAKLSTLGSGLADPLWNLPGIGGGLSVSLSVSGNDLYVLATGRVVKAAAT